MLVTAMMMLIITHVMNLSSADENPDVGTYFRRHTKMGVYMPIIFNIRLFSLTILLFAYHITPTVPSYFVIIIQIGYLLFIIFGRPHKKPFDTFRAGCLEIGMLYIFVARFSEIRLIAEYVDHDSIVYPVIAYLEYGFYGLAVTVSSISMIYHFIKRFKGSKVGESPEKDKDQDSNEGQPLPNDSLAKADSPNKPPRIDNNPLIFDVDDVDVDIPQTSVMSLDQKSSPSRPSRARKLGSRRR